MTQNVHWATEPMYTPACAKRARIKLLSQGIAIATYTAPQHKPGRRRSLSRRTVILLAAGLLIPACLLAVAKTPVHADPSNNPIFATMQDVQNAINSALTPINNAIASLQQQQSTQAQQISNLQNSTSKQLRAYDANGNEIGLLVSHGSGGNGLANDTIYSTVLNRFIYLNEIEISGNFLGFSIQTRAYFQSSDCTGTPYNNDPAAFNDILPYTPTTYYITHYLEEPVSIRSGSLGMWDVSTNSVHCVPDSENVLQAYQLYPVTLPFPTPIAFPLKFKYL